MMPPRTGRAPRLSAAGNGNAVRQVARAGVLDPASAIKAPENAVDPADVVVPTGEPVTEAPATAAASGHPACDGLDAV